MSTSATNGTRYSIVGKDEKVNVCRRRSDAILKIVLAVVYIGVAGNFFVKLNNFDKCSGTYEPHLSNLCENLNTWNWCAIAGATVPGLLNLIFASFMFFRFCSKQHQQETEEVAQNATCNKLWRLNSNACTILNIVIFFILLATKATSTRVAGAEGLEAAATIYMYIVGIEVFLVAILIGIGAFCVLCGTACACCGVCIDAVVQNV